MTNRLTAFAIVAMLSACASHPLHVKASDSQPQKRGALGGVPGGGFIPPTRIGGGTGGAGDITGVTAGTGMTGGGLTGSVTLNVDTASIQSRVSGACVAGSAIRAIGADGVTLTCEVDDDTTYSVFTNVANGLAPLSGGGTVNYLRADGTWAAPVDTTYTASTGLSLAANAFSVTTNGISDALIRQGAALTVIGRSTNTTGNVADIAAAADGDVLRRSGVTLGFGAIPESSVTGLVTDLAAKAPTTRTISTTAPLSGGGDLSADRTLSITTNGVTDALLRQGAAASVVGRSAATIGNVADIAALADGDVLRRSAGVLGFGTIPEASVTGVITGVTVTSPACAAGSFMATLTGGAASGDAPIGGTCVAEPGDISNVSVSGPISGGGASGSVTIGLGNADYSDITVSGTGTTWTIDPNVVTYAKMQDVSATSRFIGRITAGAGDPEELTGTQATTLLDTFATAATTKGLVPGSNSAGATAFLNGNGGWTVPAGAGDITDVVAGVALTGGGTTGSVTLDLAFSSDFQNSADTLDLSAAVTAPGSLAVATTLGVTGATTLSSYALISSAVGASLSGVATANNLLVRDTTTTALGVGGSVLFQGAYTGTTVTEGAEIKMFKTNGTDGNYSFDLAFATRANLGSLTERMRISDQGAVTIGGTLAVTGNLSTAANLTADGNATIGIDVTKTHTINGITALQDTVGTTGFTSGWNLSLIDTTAGTGAGLGGSMLFYAGAGSGYGAGIKMFRTTASTDKYDLAFGTRDAADVVERLRIRNDGGMTFNGTAGTSGQVLTIEAGTLLPKWGGAATFGSTVSVTGALTVTSTIQGSKILSETQVNDHTRGYEVFGEFLNVPTEATTTGAGSYTEYDNGFTFLGGFNGTSGAENNRPGQLTLRAYTSTDTLGGNPAPRYARVVTGENGSGDSWFGGGGITKVAGAFYINSVLSPPVDDIDSYTFHIGLFDTNTQTGGTASSPPNGIYCRATTASANIQVCTAKAATLSCVDTSPIVPIAEDVWIKCEFTVNAGATNVDFTVTQMTSSVVGTASRTTQIPNTSSNVCGLGASVDSIDNAGTGLVSVDYLWMDQTFTTAR